MRHLLSKLRVSSLGVICALVASCGGTDEDTTPTLLAREVSYVLCEESKTALAQVDQALVSAGVQVYSKGCASDGVSFPTACGVGVYFLRTVEVPKFQEQLARSLSFRAPGEFTSFFPGTCPAQ